MHHKDIKLIVLKQLKKQFPNWNRLSLISIFTGRWWFFSTHSLSYQSAVARKRCAQRTSGGRKKPWYNTAIATVDKTSVRQEVNRLKMEFEQLCSDGKVSSKIRVVMVD